MIRGTTAQFKFKLPYTKKDIIWATIKFWQTNNPNESLPITRRLADCIAPDDSTELCVSLTGEETLRFLDKYKAKMQLRAQHANGTVFGSKIKLITVYPMLDDIIEEDPTLPAVDEDGWIILDGEVVDA